MSIIWSEEELTLLETVRATMSTREITRVFTALGYHRSGESIRKKSKKMGLKFKDFGKPVVHGLIQAEMDAINSTLQLRDATTDLCSEPEIPLTPAQKGENTKQQRILQSDLFTQLKEIRAQVSRNSSISTKQAMGHGKQSLVALLSDWHIGHIVVDTENNTETFNTEIGLDRVKQIPMAIVDSLTNDQLDSIDECVVILAGDMISGEGIFPHHEMQLHDHAAQQVLNAVRATWEMIQRFRQIFPLVRIVTTKGNHGRTGASPEANWDNMIYQQLELLVDLTNDSNLTIKNRYGNFATVNVKGWKGHIRHKGPAQTETAAGANKASSWMLIHEWDFFCYGHWHHWGANSLLGKPVFRNGSLIGEDDFAESLGKRDDPTQLVFGVTEEQIATFINPIKFE